ncbi:MAG: biotin/lipoyl-binding protein [Gammaproteobacteria bacterium]|nr:biotin/lipoyl-binding protein [Gammaproteobacteria bacterium]
MAKTPRKWVIILPILIGVAAFIFLKKNQREPVQAPVTEKAKLVRVIPAPQLAAIPQAVGYGTVQPVVTWDGVSQVRGRVVEKHPQLRKGAIIQSGELLLRIDPTDYQLAIAQTEADIAATQAQIDELKVKEANTRAALKIEEQALSLSQKELDRKKRLVGKGGVSRSDLETQERALLSQQQSVRSQRNTLNLLPTQRALLEAQQLRNQAKLKSTQRDLANTAIHLPFTARIAEVKVEQDQYVRDGEVLVQADDLSNAEIEVDIPIDRLGHLIRSNQVVDLLGASNTTTENGLGLTAQVRLQHGGITAKWPARFARISDTLDPKTRTVGIIVEVDAPYSQVKPGIRPPLLKGLFVEVLLQGTPRTDSVVIPRTALHGHNVYVVDSSNRLALRRVELDGVQSDIALIHTGLKADEQVIISDLSPAIEGMLLAPRVDQQVLEHLTRQAGDQTGSAQ